MPMDAAGNPSPLKTNDLKKKLLSTQPLPPALKMIDGSAFHSESMNKAIQVSDYTLDSAVVAYKNPNEHVIETCKFFFKKPKQLRVEVKKAGAKSGSILVLDKEGKIKAKPGSILGFAKIDVTPDSKMLQTANGFSMLRVDYETLMSDMKQETDRLECRCLVSENTMLYDSIGREVRIMQFLSKTTDDVLHSVVIDASLLLPIEWTIFKDGKIFSTSAWRNLKLDSGLDDKLFTLN